MRRLIFFIPDPISKEIIFLPNWIRASKKKRGVVHARKLASKGSSRTARFTRIYATHTYSAVRIFVHRFTAFLLPPPKKREFGAAAAEAG